jgi:transaldolase
MEVVRRLTSSGISTNVTTCFTLPQIMAAARAAREGLRIAQSSGVDTSRCRSAITYFMARLIERPELLRQAGEFGVDVTDTDRKWLGIAVFKRAYKLLQEGGYPSKMLLCSLRKGPAVNGTMRFWDVEEFAGGDIILTLPPQALELLFELDDNLVFDPDAIHRPAPQSSLDKMLKLPYCVQAYEPDGLSPDQFNLHPGMVYMLTEFCNASAALEAYMGQRLALPGLIV